MKGRFSWLWLDEVDRLTCSTSNIYDCRWSQGSPREIFGTENMSVPVCKLPIQHSAPVDHLYWSSTLFATTNLPYSCAWPNTRPPPTIAWPKMACSGRLKSVSPPDLAWALALFSSGPKIPGYALRLPSVPFRPSRISQAEVFSSSHSQRGLEVLTALCHAVVSTAYEWPRAGSSRYRGR